MDIRGKRAGLLAAALVMVLGGMLPAMTIAQENTSPAISAGSVVLEHEVVVDGFSQPTYVTNAADGSDRIFVVERNGTVRVVVDGELLPEPFIDITERVLGDSGERGLFTIAFHPDYAQNGFFYLSFTAQPDGANTIARFQVSDADPNLAEIDSELTILSIPDQFDTHNGGGLVFGPDGYLYISTGDGGGLEDGDPSGNAQNPDSLLGKLLRIDVDGDEPYDIPPDNPFVSDDDYRPEIVAIGLRNPWRMSFDRQTGDLFISDVGSGNAEEINVLKDGDPGGQNFGWPVMEGTQCFPFWITCSGEDLTPPAIEYSHDSGCSVSGAQVYRGGDTPFFDGTLVFGDWCSGRIWMASETTGPDPAWAATQLLDTDLGITSIGEDEDGELYITDMWQGALIRLIFQEVDSDLVISSLNPDGAVAGTEGFTLTVTGSGFSDESIVRWNGRPLPTTFVSDTLLQTEIQDSDLGLITSIDIAITVATAGSSGTVSNAAIFSINAFGDIAFERTWRRTDKVLLDADAVRTWIWGPRPVTSPRMEDYVESPDGKRMVQYFDKSRMEITQPAGDSGSLWYVTNGLLVTEMMTGNVQIGDGTFRTQEPADINIAGDASDPEGVTYATFATLADLPPPAEGTTITATVDREGTVGRDSRMAAHNVTAGPLVETRNHRVASVFWEFMLSEGLVYDGGEQTNDQLFENPFYATGLPVTEAYWTIVEVGGTLRTVLVQAFERRVLTFTPDNTPEWRVEAGNVGRHYYVWRYGEHLLPFNR